MDPPSSESLHCASAGGAVPHQGAYGDAGDLAVQRGAGEAGSCGVWIAGASGERAVLGNCPPLTKGNKPEPGGPPPSNAVRDDGFPVLCGSFVNIPTTAQWHRREGARDLPIGMIGEVFGNLGRLGKPTVDKTGLTGNYDFLIDYVMEPQLGVELPPTVSGPSFKDALRDQLGLKIEAGKGPFSYLIVDHIEHPTEN